MQIKNPCDIVHSKSERLITTLKRTEQLNQKPRLLIVKQHGGSVPDLSLPAIMLQQESHLKILRILETNPQISQRELSEALGVSLGKTNYCLKALLDKGLIKIQNFRNSNNKLAYSYLLTPYGFEQKAHMTIRYLQRKTKEYDLLRQEIAELERELQKK